MFFGNGLEDEVVGEPSEDDECRPRDGSDSEGEEFGVVRADLGDGALGERRLVFVVLRLPVYEDEGEDCADGSNLVEEEA
jgi:hypothetical protein